MSIGCWPCRSNDSGTRTYLWQKFQKRLFPQCTQMKEKELLNLIHVMLLNGDGGVPNGLQYIRLCCNITRPIYTPHHMSDVQYSWFLCCTKFLFSVLYKIPFFQWCTIFLISVMYNTPVFCDVQYSWFQWCTIFLYSAMYNIPVFHVV